ncbi:hypothetical protein K239x_15560 [Planctomycetes bacterium K23_9]|uniref:Uncharacterized protein n=2 Tax=Stieleria marina TaxID=1930275 RepID=A0A517NR56_9BACT|nr:hypothetical protein K239x_15560 [Planctomycetes bacterium K23_9]
MIGDASKVSAKEDAAPVAAHVQQSLSDNLAKRGLSTELHGAWQVLHGILAYGQDFTLQTGRGSQPAVDYLLSGGALDGFNPRAGDMIGSPPRRGVRVELQPDSKIGQGHRDQWLAVILQSGVSEDDSITTVDGDYTIRDWINQTQFDVPLNLETEFSWTLIALTALDPTTQTWVARDGETYSTELLLQSEVQQYQESAQSGACGGTHRLIGIAMALNKRRAEKLPMDGVWAEAEQVVSDAIEVARQNQNPDGSYSTSYFHRQGWTRDLGESLGTTGHVLELLAIAAPQETLSQPWIERTARRLCEILDQCEGIDLECGVLYHALHGLAEFQKRSVQD